MFFLCSISQKHKREQRKYETRVQTSVDNAVNNPHHEIKFESCVKNKDNFFIKQNTISLF